MRRREFVRFVGGGAAALSLPWKARSEQCSPWEITVTCSATLESPATSTPSSPDVAVSGASGVGGPGVLRSSNATLGGGSTFAVELNGTTVGSGYDALAANGTMTLVAPTLAVSCRAARLARVPPAVGSGWGGSVVDRR